MKRIAVFKEKGYGDSINKVVNGWLKNNPEVNILDVETTTADPSNRTVIVTLLYELPEKEAEAEVSE